VVLAICDGQNCRAATKKVDLKFRDVLNLVFKKGNLVYGCIETML
jgi:hypothetical protein